MIGDSIDYSDNEYDVVRNADALLICTEWSLFRNPDFDKLKENMNDSVIFDGRNLFDLDMMNEKGFYYQSIGRKLIN